jgi:hypothetical protein
MHRFGWPSQINEYARVRGFGWLSQPWPSQIRKRTSHRNSVSVCMRSSRSVIIALQYLLDSVGSRPRRILLPPRTLLRNVLSGSLEDGPHCRSV